MNVLRTTTLAIGASLIGSAFQFFPINLSLMLLLLLLGCAFLSHGTGFLQECIIPKLLKFLRSRKPIIAIINDLPWSANKETYAWAWSKMEPNKWFYKIRDKLLEKKISAEVKFIKIVRSRTRWFLDRYNIVLNPYGSVYPEVDIKDLTVWKSILHYVLNGGIVVNVADIPFYWAYDPKREIRYELVRYSHQYVLMYKLNHEKGIMYPTGVGSLISVGPYTETPFSQELRIRIINTEFKDITSGINKPLRCSLKFKVDLPGYNNLDNVAINRAIILAEHVKSLVKEISWANESITPLCSINFGKGKFIASLLFLEYNEQPENVKEIIVELLCDLIVKELENS
ncbi:MAG: hypothetical protein ACTSXX_12325 [Candidatus Baldrarchaeia archaeon]